MINYIVAGILVVLFVLAIYSYFFKKDGNGVSGGCAGCSCSGTCPLAKKSEKKD